jgi:hypothetical protein
MQRFQIAAGIKQSECRSLLKGCRINDIGVKGLLPEFCMKINDKLG